MLNLSVRFYQKVSRHPVRTIMDGVIFIVVFQILKFWIRQAGIYSSVKVPVSLFGPVIGYDMLTGPFIEILNSFYKIEKWKVFLFGFLVCVSLFELLLILMPKSQSQNCERRVTKISQSLHLLIFIFLPLFFLPTNYESLEGCLYSILSFILIYSSVRFIPKSIQTISLISGVLLLLLSWQNSFNEGLNFYKKCPSQVTLIFKEQFHPETGCWVSSSEKYIVLMQGSVNSPSPKIIPRDAVIGFRFLERGDVK